MMIEMKLTITTVIFMVVDELQHTVILMTTVVKLTISIVDEPSYKLTNIYIYIYIYIGSIYIYIGSIVT